ncbi:uncharacterized protein LOC119784260 [Cyprinodon tularosa]|uniref:uncharacterized protein LOC119784260 n=1 Tax=Cyprinodon tularosa TaxID=77115 RepID=UPI0018E21674|nr:uncharacterized protein LOC119784260 [Cyprinodon tularosa]
MPANASLCLPLLHGRRVQSEEEKMSDRAESQSEAYDNRSNKRPSRDKKRPRRFLDGFVFEKGDPVFSSEERTFSDEEQLAPRGRSRRDRIPSGGSAGGPSGGSAGVHAGSMRHRSRSPHHPRWKTHEEPDEKGFQPLRFFPKRIPGVQPPLNVGNPQPGEIFEYFFDNEVLTLVCDFTNKGAARNLEKGRKFSWTEMQRGENRL